MDKTPQQAGSYRCIVIDPPWPMKKIVRKVRPRQHPPLDYPCMTIEQISALPIREWTAANCHVFLWTTQKWLPVAFEVLKSWGVSYQCLMTWCKNVGFTPYSWMYSTEHVLFGRIGKLKLRQLGLRLHFNAKVAEHSRKPDVFYQRVRKATFPPRLNVFARFDREGFDGWGLEAP